MYVLSTGRSGSTLLESLLDTHPDLVSAGELLLLGHLLGDPGARCSCGELLYRCAFWTAVIERGDIDPADPPAEPFRETLDAGRVLRRRWVLGLIRGRTPRRARGAVQRYARKTASLIDAVATVAEAPMVVDASKDLYRMTALSSGGLDLSTIRLVRDPRGFVCSVTGASSARVPWSRIVRASSRWATQELLMRLATRPARRAGSVCLVRYEDLASRPHETLRRVAFWSGLRDDFDVAGFRSHHSHALAGNPMRSRSEPIRLDDRWRTALGAGQRSLVWAITAPLARPLGYQRRPGVDG